MSQAGTAFIPFEGDFSNVLSDARRYGERAGAMFGGDFGSRADKAMGSSFRGTTRDMEKSSGRAGSRAGSDYGRDFGKQAERGMGGSLKKIAGGLASAFAVVKGVQLFGDMIGEAREAAKVGRITANVIKQTGGVAKVSASEVGDLSTALSNKAGIDDELIQTGANLLLTFKLIRNEVGAGNDIFDRATTAAVDMSVQFGSVDSASKMLGKVLNDPIKGISALGRAGVTFSEDQKTTIKAMVGANDVLGAQKIILGEVESQVGGAAAAAADPLDRLTVAWGNLLELGGSKVLPWAGEVADGLVNFLPDAVGTAERVIGRLVDRGTDLAQAFWDKVEPAAMDVWASLQNLWEIGQDVVEIGQPMAKALALLGGAAVLGAITGTAAGLESVTGFLADNEWAVEALVDALLILAAVKTYSILADAAETFAIKAMYANDKALEMGSSAATWGTGILSNAKLAGQGIKDMGANILTVPDATQRMATEFSEGADKLKAGASGLADSLLSPQVVMTGLVVGVTALVQGFANAHRQANEFIDDLKPPDFDATSGDSIAEYSRLLDSAAESNQKAASKNRTFGGVLKATFQVLTPYKNTILDTALATDDLAAAQDKLRLQGVKLENRYRAVWEGVTGKKVTDGLSSTGDNIGAFTKRVATAQEWVEAFDLDPLAMSADELTKAIKTNLDGLVTDAGYKGPAIKEALKLSPDELKAQVDAWQQLSSAVSSTWSGQLDVVSALGAQLDVSSESIDQWYALHTIQAQTFAQNIGTAMQQGYDPALISRLLQAGPAQAAPLLQAMVDGHKNGLLTIVNEGEAALGKLSTLAVEMARIQNMAMNAQTDDMTQNMGLGLKEAEAVSRLGAFATADAVAHELGIGAEKVAYIADLYGISLADAVNPILTGVGKPTITVNKGTLSQSLASAGFNTGGWVDGPNVNRDVVPAMLTPGEVVVNKDMTNKWGADNLLALNAGRLPAGWSIQGYNQGGQVTGDLQGMHPELLRRLQMWAGAVGQRYNVGSGYRSVAEQIPLYQKYLAGKGPVAAVPGSSMHNYGLASDGNHWRSKNPGAFGLDFAVPSEAWHVQPTDARALKGGSSHGFIPPAALPKPPKIGPWSLAQGGEGTMDRAYSAALEWASSQMMSYGDPGMGEIASGSPRELGQKMAAARGWTGGQWTALDRLWNRESGWRVNADNPNSSAYGIPQALPGSKMASAGGDWRTNAATQIAWGLDYIAGRYGSPTAAWAHSEKTSWYNDGGEVFKHRNSFDSGGTLAEGWNMVRNDTGAPEPLVPAGQGPAVVIEKVVNRDGVDMALMIQQLSLAVAGGRL